MRRFQDVAAVAILPESAVVHPHGAAVGLIIERYDLATDAPVGERTEVTRRRPQRRWVNPHEALLRVLYELFRRRFHQLCGVAFLQRRHLVKFL